ncbi:MAG TPA: hypothetical protein VF306_17405 [Pirellulales bacterium]
MPKPRWQFTLRSLFFATSLIAAVCWALPDIRVLIPWLLRRPHEWQIERNYAKKGGEELKRLRDLQASLPKPDPQIAKEIEMLEWGLNFEPLPESLGGGDR